MRQRKTEYPRHKDEHSQILAINGLLNGSSNAVFDMDLAAGENVINLREIHLYSHITITPVGQVATAYVVSRGKGMAIVHVDKPGVYTVGVQG